MTTGARQFELQALTDIWTGDVNGKAERLVPTGLLGSIRWWFEVLVRGLGGSPCDPSSEQKTCSAEHHCVVCELFGCTGWARKFRFDVRDVQGTVVTRQLKKGAQFHLHFTPLRKIENEEWALLELTMQLISEFGALGGKTVFKPTEELHRAPETHHQDYGLVQLRRTAARNGTDCHALVKHVSTWVDKCTVSDAAWASCKHMWFVSGQYLSRQDEDKSTFNRVLGRKGSKKCRDCGAVHLPRQRCPKTGQHPKRFSDDRPMDDWHRWLAGGIGASKKVFSFKSPTRTFGFVRHPSEFDQVRDELRAIWGMPETNDWFVSGEMLIDRLFSQGRAT